MSTKQHLLDYIHDNQVVWQEADNLIEVSDNSVSDCYQRLKGIIERTESLKLISKNDLLNSSLTDIASWSTENDILISSDNGAVICIPKKDKSLIGI